MSMRPPPPIVERLLIGLFIVGALGLFLWTNAHRPRVLVLQSYDTGYIWSRDVATGIRRELDHQAFYSVRWHYMDLKRHPWPEFKENAGIQARRAIDKFQPDVLIAVDDDAQQYAAKFYTDHPRTRIVFAGLNGDMEKYGYDKATNVTGILERKQLAALERAIADTGIRAPDGKAPRLVVLGDRSGSVKEDVEHMEAFRWTAVRYGGARLVGSYDEWQQTVAGLKDEADILVTTNYRRLTRQKGSRELVPPEEIVTWTEAHSPRPLIGTNGFYVEDGGALAIGTSGYEQGEVAAKAAIRIIENKVAPRAIPVIATSQFVVYMRPALMKRRDLRLPPLYEAFARATNNYFE